MEVTSPRLCMASRKRPVFAVQGADSETAWLVIAQPLRGARHHHAETLLGCVAFTERGASHMKSLDFGRCALTSCAAVAMLAGCGGSQPPIGAPAAISAPNKAHGKKHSQTFRY